MISVFPKKCSCLYQNRVSSKGLKSDRFQTTAQNKEILWNISLRNSSKNKKKSYERLSRSQTKTFIA